MGRGLVIRKRLVYKQVMIAVFVLALLALLVWGVLSLMESMNFFSGTITF
jgi:hypothetical protein